MHPFGESLISDGFTAKECIVGPCEGLHALEWETEDVRNAYLSDGVHVHTTMKPSILEISYAAN